MSVIWKDFIYSNVYEISNIGDFRNKNTGKFLKARVLKTGYMSIAPSHDGKQRHYSLHRIIAIHFIANPNNYEQINHKDGNKINNNILNLEWVTARENVKHSYTTGLKINPKGPKNPKSKLKIDDILEIKRLLNLKVLQKDIAKKFNISQSIVSKIKIKKMWEHL